MKKTNGANLLLRAFNLNRAEIFLSLKVLGLITLVFTVLMYIAESPRNPDYTLVDSFLWTFVKYVEDPAEMVSAPATLFGQIVGTFVGIIGIALFAVPAGLIGSGLMQAMDEQQREKQIKEFHGILLRNQKLTEGRNLKAFIQGLPDRENSWFKDCQFKFIKNNTDVSDYQLRGMDLKDILDVCKAYPYFRVKNRAAGLSSSIEGKNNYYVVEHFPINRPYGCFIDRGSKVTIISTSSRTELGTGNFSFYLAKFAGFNYISKDFDADQDYAESYYNNSWQEPVIDGKRLKGLENEKKKLRELFLADLESVTRDMDTWAISILNHIKNYENNVDIHFAHNTEDGMNETIYDRATYSRIYRTISSSLKLSTSENTRYPLINKGGRGKLRNLFYKMREDGCRCNAFNIRVSTNILEFDPNLRVITFLIAKAIKENIEPDRPLPADDVEDMNRTGYGYMKNKEQNC